MRYLHIRGGLVAVTAVIATTASNVNLSSILMLGVLRDTAAIVCRKEKNIYQSEMRNKSRTYESRWICRRRLVRGRALTHLYTRESFPSSDFNLWEGTRFALSPPCIFSLAQVTPSAAARSFLVRFSQMTPSSLSIRFLLSII